MAFYLYEIDQNSKVWGVYVTVNANSTNRTYVTKVTAFAKFPQGHKREFS